MKKRFFWLVGVVAVFVLLLGTVEIGMADTVSFDYTGAPFIGYAGLDTQQFLGTNITGNITFNTLDLPAGWQNSQFSYLSNSEISSFSLVAGPDGITSANGSIPYAGFAFSQGQIVGWNLKVNLPNGDFIRTEGGNVGYASDAWFTSPPSTYAGLWSATGTSGAWTAAVPEPASLTLLVSALLGLTGAFYLRQRWAKA
jgi:hypothetical protein